MVRLDRCVEALYDGATMDDKQKTLHILKVMKGAISMSKSKTGECIFRSNKVENVHLQRLVKGHKKNSLYEVARIDTNKKMVVNRWSKLLENQTNCSAETLFGEILDVENPDLSSSVDRFLVSPSPTRLVSEKDSRLRRLLDLRLSRYDSQPKIVIRKRRRHEFSSCPTTAESQVEVPSNQNGEAKFVTEKPEIREKYPSDDDAKAVERKPNNDNDGSRRYPPVQLPDISGHQGFKFRLPNSSHEEEAVPVEQERDVCDWRNWSLKDKTWIKRYITKEKTRQEDLLLRNALNNIEKEMSGANTIKRHQIRQKLQLEKEREATEKRRTEALSRQDTAPKLTVDIQNKELPVPSNTDENKIKLPELKKGTIKITKSNKSPRKSDVKPKKNIFLPKRNPLSKALDEIDNDANGLHVIIEHPVNTKKSKDVSVVV